MSHAEVCPLCRGSGKRDEALDDQNCHGCDGKGWVTVSDDGPFPFVPVPYYPICPQNPHRPDYQPYDPYDIPYRITWTSDNTSPCPLNLL